MRTESIEHALPYAVRQAINLGHPDKADIAFREKVFKRMPGWFISPISNQYQKIYERLGRRDANLMLLNIDSKLTNETLRLASSDDDLVQYAKLRAKACSRIRTQYSTPEKSYDAMCSVVKRFGLKPITLGKKFTLTGAIGRMCDDTWWRRALRKKHKRNRESLAIQLGLVCKQKGIYASDEAVHTRKEEKIRTSLMLEAMEAVNELDQSYTLKELQDLSVSNPAIRRAELMTRIAGFEEYAQTYGHVGEFYTFTCPSSMHARMSVSGDQNPKYKGTTPGLSQAYLNKQWSKIRASLNRAGIHFYGMRVAEPQHDGTPHWHMLLFMAPEHIEIVRETMLRYALEIDGNEKGAKKHRFTALAIDWSKGTAAGYIAKYISKNIDAHGVDEDLFGNDAKQSALRVDAWASTWGIRQFQQVGGPSVTIWRVLRNLKEIPDDGLINQAYEAADNGNWCQYMEIMGGHTSTKKDWPIRLAKEDINKLNQYGEPIGLVIVGITLGQLTYRSKVHIWSIRLKSEDNDIYTGFDSVNVTLCEVMNNDSVTEVSQKLGIDELFLDNDTDQDSETDIPIGDENDTEISKEHLDNNLSFLKKGTK